MASLGSYLLLTAFVTCAYAASISIAGARRRSRRLIESGVGAFYLTAAVMVAASAVMIYSFVTGDYTIKYVQHYSDAVQPLFYKITSYWGGLDGSIMFWVFLLSIFGSTAVYVNRERHRELIPYVVAIISIVEMFFLFLMVIHNNPFDTFVAANPTDGRGLNPLLQNFYMAIHPPTMYLGFVGLTIPYAFGMAALITGYLDDSWLRAVRRWTMIAWFCLSFGLMLGMIWAYEELGWGGYWGWDPVENAGLLPWFTATAFLHSVMVQEKRGMLRVWNVSLVIITFFLTIFGTFMTRSGVVQSVHAFGEDIALARMFTAFMIAIITISFGFVIYRLPLLRSRNELDSWVSREAAFLINNWILLFAALFVLFATMFPTLSEAVTGERLTVGPPFFNKWMLPIGLILLFLTGYGPLTAWRKSTLINLRDSFLIPGACALAVGIAVVALGVRVWASGICFAFSAFVVGTIGQEFWRGARVRQGATGTDILTAAVGLIARNKRRYGGYIIHVGVVLIFLGFAGNGFSKEEDVNLKPGQQRGRRLHRPAQRRQGDRRRPEADDHGRHDGAAMERDRADVSGALVLPQARGGADHRGCHPPRLRGRPLPGDAGVQRRGPERQHGDSRESARQLGLGRLRCSRHRHRRRASAGHGLHVRAREPAGWRGDGVDAAAVAAALAVNAACAADGSGHAEERASQTGRKRDSLHVRLP
jgi:cytochrome c-type biogenesis protein CcmF